MQEVAAMLSVMRVAGMRLLQFPHRQAGALQERRVSSAYTSTVLPLSMAARMTPARAVSASQRAACNA